MLQIFKGDNIFLLSAILKGLVGRWCTSEVLPYRHLQLRAPSVWADASVQHRKPKYCTVSSCKIWSKVLSSTRWLILTRKLGKSCQNQQTALGWCLCRSAWCRCDFNVSTYRILNMWSTILLEILKLPIKAKANTTIWSTNSHVRLISIPSPKKKSTIDICLYRHMSICVIQFNTVCASTFLLLSPLPP